MSALLDVENLQKRFGSLRALDGFSLTAERGKLTGLIGPNGAGKTTAFACISGATKPTAGKIVFDGGEIEGKPYHRVARLGIARTYQVVQTFAEMTVLEAVTVGALMRHPRLSDARAKAADTIEFVGLGPKRDTLGKSLTIADKKRLEVARALATEPALLLLDEVMAGLTPAEAQAAVALLREILGRGITIVMVEHVMEVLMPIADHIVVLSAGKTIFSGTPHAAANDPAVLEAYLGPPIT
ncbi:MAG: ABC transporter ATP-binding protein [Candidatus Eremiobacteraeota bacterium]|nr:ABC transporter ATP-binding protein [Candidatus Eremiobacteraeota bacterium]